MTNRMNLSSLILKIENLDDHVTDKPNESELVDIKEYVRL